MYVTWVDLAGLGLQQLVARSQQEPDLLVQVAGLVHAIDRRRRDVAAPRKLFDGAGLADQFNQRLAVDTETGNLGLIYNNTGTGRTGRSRTSYSNSRPDRGATWTSPPTPVSSAMTDETTVDADLGNQYGDYNGLSVVKGVFFPSWTDRPR